MTNALLTRFSAAARDDDARGPGWPVPENAGGHKLSSAFLRLIARMNLRAAGIGEPRDGDVGFRRGLCPLRCYCILLLQPNTPANYPGVYPYRSSAEASLLRGCTRVSRRRPTGQGYSCADCVFAPGMWIGNRALTFFFPFQRDSRWWNLI